MGAYEDRCASILPPRPAILCCHSACHNEVDWALPNIPGAQQADIQSINTNGGCQCSRTQVRLSLNSFTFRFHSDNPIRSFNNLTLKYVDASMYQVARGLLLPITVAISFVLLHSRPSLRVLISCGIVTIGFFVGVFVDNLTSSTPTSAGSSGPSLVGILFGVLSSCTTALHAVVIKRSLDAVNGNTLQLAWYSNALSSIVMVPIVVIGGEVPGILALFFGAGDVSDRAGDTKGMSALATFVWGSTLTVSLRLLSWELIVHRS